MRLFWIALALLMGTITAFAGYLYVVGFERETVRVKNFFQPTLDKRLALLMGGVCAALLGITIYSDHFGVYSGIQLSVHTITLSWLATIGVLDHRYRVIPNQLLAAGLLFWLILTLIELFVAKTAARQLLLYSGGGCLLIGGVLWLVAIVAKGAFGMGDVKLFAVLGLLYGMSGTFVILFFTTFIMAVLAIILLISKKATRKSALPMAPFVVIGYIIAILLGI